MKRVPCPKCHHLITFDESRYKVGERLVFICEECKKEFAIRMGAGKLRAKHGEEQWDELQQRYIAEGYGCIIVIENIFTYKQVLPLLLGDNIIGRKDLGTSVTAPIETSDRSMDRKHCFLNVKTKKDGTLQYTLRDFPSVTGTFLHNRVLERGELVILADGDVITLGATTLIFRTHVEE